MASGYGRTRRRPGLASDGREVPPYHRGVVAAAHIGTFVWPLSGCAQLGTAGTLGDRRLREAAVIGDRSNRPTPVVVAGGSWRGARTARRRGTMKRVLGDDAAINMLGGGLPVVVEILYENIRLTP